jgi:hypothetical protein
MRLIELSAKPRFLAEDENRVVMELLLGIALKAISNRLENISPALTAESK